MVGTDVYRLVHAADRRDQPLRVAFVARDPAVEPLDRAVQHPGADRVHMAHVRQVDGVDRTLYRVQPVGQVMQAGDGQIARKPNDRPALADFLSKLSGRSEEHTSELQSLMRTSYAVFCLKHKIHT